VWKPYCGVRYIKLDDELSDFINQDEPFPLPAPVPEIFTEVDRLNVFDVENNMLGFQVGVKRDLWKLGKMFSVQGYANAGVFHNRIKRSNIMSVETRELVGDDSDTGTFEGRESVTAVFNHEVSDRTEISYLGELSLTGICRLNRCCAMRAGYQILWLNNVHLADDAFLATGVDARSMIFQGWHAGVEYRR
jgi:hypothetical protein